MYGEAEEAGNWRLVAMDRLEGGPGQFSCCHTYCVASGVMSYVDVYVIWVDMFHCSLGEFFVEQAVFLLGCSEPIKRWTGLSFSLPRCAYLCPRMEARLDMGGQVCWNKSGVVGDGCLVFPLEKHLYVPIHVIFHTYVSYGLQQISSDSLLIG